MPDLTKPARPRRAAALAGLLYSSAVYLAFLLVLGYAVGFFADRGVPRGIDGGARLPWPAAAAIDAALLALFAVQHTVMARPWFKRRWTRLVPVSAERSTYVLFASLALALLFWAWQPVAGRLWAVSGPGGAALLALQLGGWIVALAATFTISHWDLFGMRQARAHARGAAYRPVPFTERGLYRRVRHPLMTGFVIVFWAAPTMTVGHLLFAAAATGYILVGIAFEERDLLASLGQEYRSYRARVPALIPGYPTYGQRPAR